MPRSTRRIRQNANTYFFAANGACTAADALLVSGATKLIKMGVENYFCNGAHRCSEILTPTDNFPLSDFF
jgi:hypothetical protein